MVLITWRRLAGLISTVDVNIEATVQFVSDLVPAISVKLNRG